MTDGTPSTPSPLPPPPRLGTRTRARTTTRRRSSRRTAFIMAAGVLLSILARSSIRQRQGSASAVVSAFGFGAPAAGASSRATFARSPTTRNCIVRLLSSKLDQDSGNDRQRHPRQQQQQPQTIQSIPYNLDVENALTSSGYKRPTVNWYPGHIAKATRLLSDTLKSVDVVVEVRDARAPKATAHPQVAEWAAGRPRVVVLTHADSVPELGRGSWKRAYERFGAGRWDGSVDAQVRNQAVQGLKERTKYNDNDDKDAKNGSKGSSSKGNASSSGSGGQDVVDQAVSGIASVHFVDAKRGSGIHAINRSVLSAGSHVNARRARRGLSERPLRVGIIGYPNVGKSALINKILGRKRARTANTPGVTRSLQWIRVRTDRAGTKSSISRGKEFELLDSPGIIPANMVDQSDALLLAACNSIGTAAYDNQAVAAYLMEWIKTLHLMGRGDETAPKWRESCLQRYGFDPLVPIPDPLASPAGAELNHEEDSSSSSNTRLMTGEDMLFRIADASCRGSPEDASRKILQDFRSGRWGPVSLQLAPRSDEDEGQVKVDVQRGVVNLGGAGGVLGEMAKSREERERMEVEERDRRARAAVATARERGLELPPMVEGRAAAAATTTADAADLDDGGDGPASTDDDKSAPPEEDEIGKGLFDGW